VCTTSAILSLAAFVWWELYGTTRPIVDLRALRYRAVAAGSILGLAIGSVLFGAIVILPQYTQGVLNFTATLSGELIFVRAIFIALLTPFVARIAAAGKIDTRVLLVGGFFLVGSSQIWLGFRTTSYSEFTTLVGPAIMGGLGLSMLFVPISIAVLGAVPTAIVPKATAFQSLSLQLGGSFSTAALVTFLARRDAFHQTILAQSATVANPAIQNLASQTHAPLQQVFSNVATIVSQQAITMAYADCQWALGALTFILVPLVFVLPKRRRGAPGATQVAVE
jgi:DHA2 family multidrug resistance protein